MTPHVIHQIIKSIRDTALLQLSQLSALLTSTQQNLTLPRSWLERPKYGKNFLQGIESNTWDPEKGPDAFVMLSNQTTEQDVLFEALHKTIPRLQTPPYWAIDGRSLQMMKCSNREILTWTALLVAFRRFCQHCYPRFRFSCCITSEARQQGWAWSWPLPRYLPLYCNSLRGRSPRRFPLRLLRM